MAKSTKAELAYAKAYYLKNKAAIADRMQVYSANVRNGDHTPGSNDMRAKCNYGTKDIPVYISNHGDTKSSAPGAKTKAKKSIWKNQKKLTKQQQAKKREMWRIEKRSRDEIKKQEERAASEAKIKKLYGY